MRSSNERKYQIDVFRVVVPEINFCAVVALGGTLL